MLLVSDIQQHNSVLHIYIYVLFHIFSIMALDFILFLAALGLCCCVQTFSSCSSGGSSLLVELGLLTAEASLAVEHGL